MASVRTDATSSRSADKTRETSRNREAAMARAGKWLALRPQTKAELRTKLLGGGFEEHAVEAALSRLEELDLVDDLAFSKTWIEEATRRKRIGPEALTAGLIAKGVARPTAEQALAEGGYDEASEAARVAATMTKDLARYPMAEQGLRLLAKLTRRGFSEEASQEAIRKVLPPEGWD